MICLCFLVDCLGLLGTRRSSLETQASPVRLMDKSVYCVMPYLYIFFRRVMPYFNFNFTNIVFLIIIRIVL